jgi:hypothetical protein
MRISSERRKLEKHIMRSWTKQLYVVIASVGVSAAAYAITLGLVLATNLVVRMPDGSLWELAAMLLPQAVALVALAVTAWVAYFEVAHRTIERRYDRGECAWCRYDLAKDTVKTCPECGNPPVVQ